MASFLKNSFLYECAQRILDKHKAETDHVCIVVPNDRTRIYLNAAMAEITQKPLWALNVFGIGDLAQDITRLKPENKTTLIFLLYDIFKKHFGHRKTLSFDLENFYGLGEVLLNDFNEIDNWLADPDLIFKNIKDLKEIDALYDHLSDEQKMALKEFRLIFTDEHSSDEKQRLLQIWNIIPELYNSFTSHLLKKGRAYNGLIMREMSRCIEADSGRLPKFDTYYFIGFNALTKAEVSLPKLLLRLGKAEYIQDTDAYYHQDLKQEAGHFLRKNSRDLNLDTSHIPARIPQKDDSKGKTLELCGAPGNIAQAKLIPYLLEDIENPGAETVIVTADEGLMMPVLYALPDKVEQLNVSMGVPLQETKIFGLIRHYYKMHKADLQSTGAKQYSHKTVASVLKHPAVYRIEPEKSDYLLRNIAEKNIAVMPAATLIDEQPELFKVLFSVIPPEDAGQIFLTNLLNILFMVFERDENDPLNPKESLENEAIHSCYLKIKKLKELLEERPENFGVNFTGRLLMKILTEISVPFKGKKATGLQVLGVLETRNLDFENVIVLGMNEGNFPKIRHYSGFLTQSIRYAFDLPLVQHQDAVYAYLFYRLLQRSNRIRLVFNNTTDQNTGEQSRFISQLEYESGFKIVKKHYHQPVTFTESSEISIPKNSEVLQILENFNFSEGRNVRRISASALNIYLSCSLHFYFKYLAGLHEPTQAEDEISPANFGSILHKAAELMYDSISQKHGNTEITDSLLEAERANVTDYVIRGFDSVFGDRPYYKSLLEGKGQIMIEVLKYYLISIINIDIQYAPFQIVALETTDFQMPLKINTPHSEKTVLFKGVIDRVDLKNGTYRVIDYKTGTATKDFKNFDQIFASENNYKYKAVIQTYLYGLLLQQKMKYSILKGGIYDLKTMNTADFTPYLQMKDKADYSDDNFFMESLADFRKRLKTVVEEWFDPAIPFSQTEHLDNCAYCPYKAICSR